MSNNATKPVVAGPVRIKRYTFEMVCPGGHLDGEQFMVEATTEELALQRAIEYTTNLSRRIGVRLEATTETVMFASHPYVGRVQL